VTKERSEATGAGNERAKRKRRRGCVNSPPWGGCSESLNERSEI